MTTLADGQVLATGGGVPQLLNSAELYTRSPRLADQAFGEPIEAEEDISEDEILAASPGSSGL